MYCWSHTFHSPIPLRRETAWIMLFQGLADMGIHWKRRKLVKGHKAMQSATFTPTP